MKRIFATILIPILLITLSSCEKSDGTVAPPKSDKEQSEKTNTIEKENRDIIKKAHGFIDKKNNEAPPLIVTFKKAELHKASDLTDDEKLTADIPNDTKFYVDIEYDVSNPTSSMYAWSGYDIMLIDGEQINVGSENFGEVKDFEIQANATVKNNSIKIPTGKNVKEIKLIPAEPLKENTFTGEEPEFSPNPIIIKFK